MVDPCSVPWFREQGVLAAFVADLIADELSRLRPGSLSPPTANPLGSRGVDEYGLGLDSLERLTVASVLTATLHLQESGLEDLLLAKPTFCDWINVSERALEHFSQRLTFHTSGSTGQPKRCTHSLVTLEQEVAFLATLFESAGRILCAVPIHHVYGFLFGVLLPLRLQVPRVDIRQMTPQHLHRQIRAGDVIVSHPAHWAVLARHCTDFHAVTAGVTSTAPCPAVLAESLRSSGLRRLLEIYGSSETAGVGWRDDAARAYCLMPFWSRDSADVNLLWRAQPDGSVRADNPPDHLSWQDETRFTPVGRRDEAVQLNGINVFPHRIRQVLLEHPQVIDAGVRLMRADEGNRLKALLVPIPGCNTEHLAQDLSIWLATRLTAAELPRSFTIATAIPVSSRGKLADWSI